MKIPHLLLLPLSLFGASDYKEIGLKVWQNECRGTLDGLISWNSLEEFPSIGIGHFIWYPEDAQKKFDETFPAFIDFLKERDKELEVPSWISSKKGFPWRSKEAFEKEKRSRKVQQLRDLLSTTLDHQIAFLFERFETAEKTLAKELTETELKHLASLKKSDKGMYALIDYVNFKGTGLHPKERYHGEGWGLIQVLQNIPPNTKEEDLIKAFEQSAKKVLAKRIRNSPPSRKENLYQNGWFKRMETYTR